MKTQTRSIFTLFLFTLAILTLTACKKDKDNQDNPEPPQEITISTNGASVKAYQIVIVTVTGTTLAKDLYSGKLDTIALTFKKVSPTEMVFLTPDINPGNYSLSCEISLMPISIDILASNPISDPDGFINSYFSDASNAFDSIITNDTLAQLPPEFESAWVEMNQALEDYNTLTTAEKIQVALILQNNMKYLDDFNNALKQFFLTNKSSFGSLAELNIYKEGQIVILGAMSAIIAAGLGTGGQLIIAAIVMETAYALFTGHMSPPVYWFKKALKKCFEYCSSPISFMADFIYDPLNKTFSNFNNPKDGLKMVYNLYANEVLTFRIKPSFRSIEANDISSSNVFISGFITVYNTLSSIWTSIIGDKFGALPTYTSRTEQKYADNLSQFSISITDNIANVSAAPLSGVSSGFTTSFSTLATTNQNFNFDLIFSEDGVTSTESISAVLIPNEANSIEMLSGNNQTGALGQPLANPIKVIVKDIDGNPFPGAIVNFTANNGGHVSQSQSATGIDGIASVTWTLGGSDISQTAIVTAFKGDNTTPLTGSPITFNASAGEEAYSIEILSGNNQSGTLGESLDNPVVVIVKDIKGNPFAGTTVYFAANNGGSVSSSQVTTGADGIAGVTWTLGIVDVSQTLNVSAYKSDNTTPLQGSPLTFNASTGCGQPITDARDGQVYPTVQIGTQCWLQKNMNYQNGNSWCYDDNTSNCEIYGRLYDFQTAIGVCPSGWHEPSDEEWTVLTNYLGGESVAGGKMKSTSSWYSNGNGTNSSGFTALPGGYRATYQFFEELTKITIFWSSTAPFQGWCRILYYNEDRVGMTLNPLTSGFSVRCIKD